MLAEGWKEANIRMGLLGLEGRKSGPEQENRMSPGKAEAQQPLSPERWAPSIALAVSRTRSEQLNEGDRDESSRGQGPGRWAMGH